MNKTIGVDVEKDSGSNQTVIRFGTSFNSDDFRKLVKGGVVTKIVSIEGLKVEAYLILSDISFGIMEEAIKDARIAVASKPTTDD